MNAGRVLLRRAVFAAAAMAAVRGRGPIERAYYDALCDDEGEVDEVMGRTNALRELALMRGMR